MSVTVKEVDVPPMQTLWPHTFHSLWADWYHYGMRFWPDVSIKPINQDWQSINWIRHVL